MPGKLARSDPRPSVRVTRGAGSGQHLASVLQEGRENANIDAGFGLIWRISIETGRQDCPPLVAFRHVATSSRSLRHPAYIPGIDGLRALAVLSVMLYHLDPSILRGGFVFRSAHRTRRRLCGRLRVRPTAEVKP